MRKNWLRILILAMVFIASLGLFVFLTKGKGTTDETQEMAASSFPVLSFSIGNNTINTCYGYLDEIDRSTYRDHITPVDADLKLPVTIKTNDNSVIGISYELSSADGSQILDSSSITEYSQTATTISLELELPNVLRKDTEYQLRMTLAMENATEISYYTRIVLQGALPVQRAYDFASDFHEMSISGDATATSYIETQISGEKTSFGHVTINSDEDELLWSGFAPEIVSDVQVDFAEITSTYQALNFFYLVKSGAESANPDTLYLVQEYMRVRIGDTEDYLLDYDRTMTQIFAPTEGAVSENRIQLGIREDLAVNYVSNNEGTVVAFVQNGALWSYNVNTEEASRVFDFVGSDTTDMRALHQDHDIRIINMDENGSMNFLVYGYMNSGRHEGKNGISLYYYDSTTKVIEERLFMTASQPYQILKDQIGDLVYINASSNLCMLMGEELYEINLETGELSSQLILDGLDQYAASESGKYIAYLGDQNENAASFIYVRNLDTMEESTVTAGDDTYIKPLGYLGQNMVYGIAKHSDIMTDAAGNVTFAMNTIVILDSDLQVVKTYDEGRYYVTDAYVEDGILHLSRVTKSEENTYVDATEDSITNYATQATDRAVVDTIYEEDGLQTQVQIAMSDTVEQKKPKELVLKEIVPARNIELTLDAETKSASYYVYRKQEVIYAGEELAEAIEVANSNGAVVVDHANRYLWTRYMRNNVDLSIAVPESVTTENAWVNGVNAMIAYAGSSSYISSLSGDGVAEALQSALSDVTVIDLSGCSLEGVLYYLAQSRPVLVINGASCYVISGYAQQTVTLYMPADGSTQTILRSEAEELFSSRNVIYLTWM